VGRFVVGLAAAGAAIWAVTGKSDELSGATSYLANLHWEWVVVAIGAEAICYLALAALQRGFLLAGRVQVPLVPMVGITLAGGAIQSSLPGGPVFYAAYCFRQYRRFGADEVLAGWTLIAAAMMSFITLSALATVGLGMALGAGNALDLVEVLLGVVTVAALSVIVWAERSRLLPHLARLVRLSQRVLRRPRPDENAQEIIDGWLGNLSAVSPGPADWIWAAAVSLSNWLADCSCLVLAFVAVGAGVPWRGLLLAYGAGQLAAILPITPGGLGVVEGSLTVALVTFGGGQDSTVAAVLLYRLISFWGLLPVGWGAWGALALAGRKRRSKEPTSVLEGSPA
jgi:hypothetical protein